MKAKYLLSLSLLFLFTTITAQNYKSGTATLTDNSQVQGRISIDPGARNIIVKKNQNTRTYAFDGLSGITLGDRNFTMTNLGGTQLFAHSLVSGKASLYQVGNTNYAIERDGTVRIVNLAEDQSTLAGTLAVLFEDCNSFREQLFKDDRFSEKDLKRFTEAYNNCDYNSAYTPTEGEVKRANAYQADAARFYAGFNAAFNSVSFFNLDNTEGQTGFGIHAGVAASPGFTGSLQGNLYFTLEGSASFAGDKDFGNASTVVNFKVNTYRLVLGTEYHFNKKGTVQPFLGLGIGVTSDSFDGTVSNVPFDITGGNTIYVPKAGVLFRLKNGKHIGVVGQYISEYENDLSLRNGGVVVPLEVNNQVFTVGVSYFF